MMACPHILSQDLHPPRISQSVYREDCTQCFDSIDSSNGLDVCLECFNGGCAGDRQHSRLHHERTTHPLALNIKRKRKHVSREEPPQKMSKLAIAAETEADRYDYSTQINCLACGIQDIDKSQGKVAEVVNGIMEANTFARQEEVKAWEQEITACEHTLCMEQQPALKIASQSLGKCSACDLKENLWLCLVCGALGCGRAQYGGVGGNSHALAHSKETGHGVAVKLGSLTADGTADVYCYVCNDERIDPELATHLSHWGINISDRIKTEKSLTEMQIEQNLRWEFSMTTEDGKEMTPLFGPGFTGLKNLGNSCYLASILQCLFQFPEFIERYYHPDLPPIPAPNPAEDLETQLRKIADGLVSGRYSHPDTDVMQTGASEQTPHQQGLAPAMLKALIGRGHAEFSTMRQQDAFEFLLHLLQLISRSKHETTLPDPVNSFGFCMEQRLQCLACKKVRYRLDEMENISIPVPIKRISEPISGTTEASTTSNGESKQEFEPVTFRQCLDIFTSEETVDFTCPACQRKDGATKRSLFKTFPRILAVNARRFEIVNWLPTKQDVPVIVGDEEISLDEYVSVGLQEDEDILPEDSESSPSSAGFIPNAEALSMLEAMGFPRVRCEKALKATGNADAEAASNWLFEHMEDPDIDVPEPTPTTTAAGNGVDIAQIEELGMMGFAAPLARQALKETSGNMERAVDWLFSHPDATGDFGSDGQDTAAQQGGKSARELPGSAVQPAKFQLQSIVCHKGSSIHAGHYVAFIRKQLSTGPAGGTWTLFNDEKVVQAADADEMKKFAYIYFFRRV